jgi:hypothetical protein
MKSAKRIWLLQLIWAFLGGLPFLLLPRFIMVSTTGRAMEEIPQIEVDQVRMVGAASMGLCLATALATTRQALAWQRGMAAIFLVFMVEWSLVLTFNQQTGFYESFVPYLTVVPALGFAVLNAIIMLQRGHNAPTPHTRADHTPTRLRWLWAGQGAYFMIEAIVCLLAAEWVLGWVTGRGADDASLTTIAVQQVRIVSAWTLTLALVSLYASLEHRIRDWRQYRWVFVLALLIRAGGIGTNASVGTFDSVVALTLLIPALLFAFFGFRWTLGAAPEAFQPTEDLAPLRNANSDAPTPPIAQSGLVWLWVIQTLLLLATSLLCMFAPETVLGSVVSDPNIPEHASDGLRVSGSLLLGLASFNVFALMMSRTVYRRSFSILFFLAFAMTSIVLWLEVSSDLYTRSMAVGCSILTLFAFLNLRWAIPRPPGAMSQNDSGIAGSKPASSFIAWLVQLLLLTVAAIALLFWAESVLRFLSGGMSSVAGAPTPGSRLIHSQWHLVGILSAVVAVLTGYGMASQRDPVWRGFAFFGGFSFIALSAALIFVTFTDRYHVVSLGLFGLGVALFYLNRWIGQRPATWDTEDTDRNLDSWALMDLVAGPLMGLSVLFTKRRSSHLMGVGAGGVFTVSENVGEPSFPLNDFFEHGKEFAVQTRFANLTELDDAALDVRGCSIKFSTGRSESPLDLLMNTGTYCPAFNLLTFAGFVASKFVPTAGSRAIVRSNLIAREGGIAGLRRAPDSFAALHYYSQIVRHWVDTEGVRHLVRYRCVPEDPGQESGLPSDDDASHIWLRERLPNESRPTDYLRAELRERVERGRITMRVQAQFHTPSPGDSEDWYNPSVEWDVRECPWTDLGKLSLDRALNDADTELLQFDPGNHPLTLGIPRSSSPLDFRSMGDSEARVVRALQRLRVWMYKVLGPPTFGAIRTASEQQR